MEPGRRSLLTALSSRTYSSYLFWAHIPSILMVRGNFLHGCSSLSCFRWVVVARASFHHHRSIIPRDARPNQKTCTPPPPSPFSFYFCFRPLSGSAAVPIRNRTRRPPLSFLFFIIIEKRLIYSHGLILTNVPLSPDFLFFLSTVPAQNHPMGSPPSREPENVMHFTALDSYQLQSHM